MQSACETPVSRIAGASESEREQGLPDCMALTAAFFAPYRVASGAQVMDDAHLLTELPGSATAVVAVLRESGSLSVANLGDCGFRVVRGSGALVKSKPQQHEFNMPFQLAWSKVLPDTDTAMDAQLYELEVQEDDVLVFGSDGLFDNMWDEELTTIVQDFTRNTPKPYRCAALHWFPGLSSSTCL